MFSSNHDPWPLLASKQLKVAVMHFPQRFNFAVCAIAAAFLVFLQPAARADLAWQLLAPFPSNSIVSQSSPLAVWTDGSFYGTTRSGGSAGAGDIFKVTPAGQWTELYSFTNGVDGYIPIGALVLANDGNFYGVTQFAGANGNGTIFRFSPNDSVFTPIYSFQGGNDGSVPNAGLMQDSFTGNLYGTTYFGGSNGFGGIFTATLAGALTELYSFTNGTDGVNVSTSLTQGADGALYGTSTYGGAGGNGTIFKITTGGAYTVLYSFTNGVDGSQPSGGLVELNGTFYGTTTQGGAPVIGSPNGTVFSMTPSGSLTPLYAFTGGNDGSTPFAVLIAGNDGNLYGTTLFAGPFFGGTAYEITPLGNLTTVLSFNQATLGAQATSLVEADSDFYCLTTIGASNNAGAVIQFSSSVEQPGLEAQLSAAQYGALVDLYNDTVGASWQRKDGWLNASTDYWYGVSVGPLHYDASWNLIGTAPVVELNLPNNNLVGNMPSSFGALAGLQDLFLNGNVLSNGIPTGLSAMSQLQQLDLSYNPFGGTIPSFLGNLTQLQTLYLSGDSLTGTLPDSVTNLVELQNLAVTGNSLTGSIPQGIGSLTQMVYLDLSYNIFTNSVPDGIGDLALLQFLYLNANDLDGTLPDSLGNLTNINAFFCWGNALTGVIPDAITNMILAQSLDFSQNIFTNGVPQDIGVLTNLTNFRAHNNFLTNPIPDSITNCTQLNFIDLSANSIGGTIPDGITNLVMLQNLFLNNNQLTGGIPKGIGNDVSLQFLDLSYNSITDGIPASIGNLFMLDQLNLDNNALTGIIPDVFDSMTNMQQITLNNNQLVGSIPQSLEYCTNLNYLDFGYNQLGNSIPPGLTNLFELGTLSLDNNALTGSIPAGLGAFSQMYVIDLSVNKLTGSIPTDLGGATNLNWLTLDQNALSGGIPSQLGLLTNLQVLDLSANDLSGPIPDALTNLTLVSYLSFSSNQLTGGIPSGIGNMAGMQNLVLYGNPLGGTIPTSIASLAKLVSLVVSQDDLTNTIPDIFSGLTQLGYLDLSQNNLIGTTPPSLNDLTNLGTLLIYRNDLSGPVPLGLTNLYSLQYMDINGNNFTGTIPLQFDVMSNLHTLLAYSNSLSGRFWTNSISYIDVTYNDYNFDADTVDYTAAEEMIDNGQTVLFTPQNIPTILEEPQGLALFGGNSGSITADVVNATGYEWFLNGQLVATPPSSTLTLSNVQSSNGGDYQLIAYNSFGSATSLVATLTVAAGPPVILTEPGPVFQLVAPRTPITFAASVVGTDPLTYHWQHNSVNLVDSGRITGSQSNILTIASAVTNDSGSYQLFISNSYGSTNTVVLNLAVGVLNFTNFASVSNLQFNGTAVPTNDSTNGSYIRLTTASFLEAGSVFLQNPISFAEGTSFSTFFSFRLISNGADGITFTVQSDASTALGEPGGGLGYYGINNSVAIDYDTYLDPGDPSANYIGLDWGGTVANHGYGTPTNKLSDGNIWYSWIDYNGATGDLEVRASELPTRPATPILTSTINILTNLNSALAYFGFTAGTGSEFDQQEILSWQLSVGTESTNGPVVVLNGNAQTNVECHTSFTDLGATASESGYGALPVSVYGTYDTNSPGTYTVLYEATDTNGNSAVASRTVDVIDTIPPIVTLIGNASTNVQCHSGWTDPGATAYDLCSGNVAAFLYYNFVNIDSPGTYTNTYFASDSSENQGFAYRIVNVVDTIPPVITLIGMNPTYALTNSVYVDPGATAFDTCAGDLPLTTNAIVNTSVPGSYTVTYTATDPSGNSTTNTRTVLVVSNIPPYFTQQPTNQFVPLQGTAVLDVTAGGSPLLQYQWQLDGTNVVDGASISGSESNILTISNFQQTNSGTYRVIVSNASATVTSAPAVLTAYSSPTGPNLIQNGGFELGNFDDWTTSGDTNDMYVIQSDMHSGQYAAYLGNNSGPEEDLSQSVTAVTNTPYLVSLWVENPYFQIGFNFQISWDGTVLDDISNTQPFLYTNLQFIVFAPVTNSLLQFQVFGTYGVPLDDVSVYSVAPSNAVAPVSFVPGTIHLTNSHLSVQITGLVGQGPVIVGTSTNLLQWTPIYTNPSGSGSFEFTDSNSLSSPHRFYRATVPGP